MDPESPNTISNVAPPHCQQRSPSGRRCRMAVSDSQSGLCFRHAALQKRNLDTTNIAAALIGNVEEFRSAIDINRSLGELLKLLARDQIAPRRAAVMAYTCSLLLRTLPAIDQQEKAAKDADPSDLSDFPQHLRDLIIAKREIAYARTIANGELDSPLQEVEGQPAR